MRLESIISKNGFSLERGQNFAAALKTLPTVALKADIVTKPSGYNLYTGEAAQKRALEIADEAWQPDATQRIDSVNVKYKNLKDLLGGKDSRVLGVYGNIILIVPEQEAQNIGHCEKLLAKMVAIFEHGNAGDGKMGGFEKSKALTQTVMNAKFPLVIQATEYDFDNVDYTTSAEYYDKGGSQKYWTNYDYMVFNPALTYDLAACDCRQPAWINFYHELGHIADYSLARDEFTKAATTEDKVRHPRGYIYAGAGLQFWNQGPERRATDYERELAQQAGLPFARRKYDDFKSDEVGVDPQYYIGTYYIVDDPIHPTQFTLQERETPVSPWIPEKKNSFYKNY